MAPCTWVWICPRLEGPRLIWAFPERSLQYGIPPWMRSWPLCAAWGGIRLWRKRTSLHLPPLHYASLRLAAPALHVGRVGIRRPPAPALHWIAIHVRGCCCVLHYLHDYFLVRASHAACAHDLQAFQDLCHDIGVPLASEKLALPTRCLQFLGITLDSSLQEMRLPPDKLSQLRDCLHAWWTWQKCTKWELLSLIGVLPFACKVVRWAVFSSGSLSIYL